MVTSRSIFSRPLLRAEYVMEMTSVDREALSREVSLDSAGQIGDGKLCTRDALSAALLTGGADRHYSLGVATALISQGVALDVIGSDELESPDLHGRSGVRFLNLRGDQNSRATLTKKILRVLVYYLRLIRYAARAKPEIFHILWNNKVEFFDRTLLMMYYKLLRKKIVLTVHNVNKARRDGRDTWLNRLTLRIQYRLADHMFVHTEKMKRELLEEFGEKEARITLIPYGINNSVPQTDLDSSSARQCLGIRDAERTILFFGHIAPYKGLEHLLVAFRQILASSDDYRLIIAGRPKNCEAYWAAILDAMSDDVLSQRMILRADFIPDEETERYFKAADVLVLPYTHIYQSGVLSLGYRFGLPVIGTDVGSFREDILEGKTGFLCRASDPADLARAIQRYFDSNLYRRLAETRQEISEYAQQRYSWGIVGGMTCDTYLGLAKGQR